MCEILQRASYVLDLTYALSLPVEHSPQTTCLHPALSCAAASIFLLLYLYPAVHISFSRSILQVFLGRPLPLWLYGVQLMMMMIACLYHLHLFPFFVFHFSLTGQRSCSWLMELCVEWNIYIPYNHIQSYMVI